MQTDGIAEVDESKHMDPDALNILYYLGSVLLFVQVPSQIFFAFNIFVLFKEIVSIVGPVATVALVHLLLCEAFLVIILLSLVIRVARLVVHCIVDIRTLMIEELRKRHHSGILEILAKTTSDQMGMKPDDVFFCYGCRVKEFRIVLENFDKLIAILLEFLSFANYVPIEILVLQQLHFLLVPENCIVDVLWQVSDQIEPPRFFAFLVFIQEISQQDPILPVP